MLRGETRGYRHHPQLTRFREQEGAIGAYLTAILDESIARGYKFDASKVARVAAQLIPVTSGQIQFEWKHLRRKLTIRNPLWKRRVCRGIDVPDPHPLFVVVEGDVEAWER